MDTTKDYERFVRGLENLAKEFVQTVIPNAEVIIEENCIDVQTPNPKGGDPLIVVSTPLEGPSVGKAAAITGGNQINATSIPKKHTDENLNTVLVVLAKAQLRLETAHAERNHDEHISKGVNLANVDLG